MLWTTKNNGNFRVVRLTRRFAFKTPRILEFKGLDFEWKHQKNPPSRRSFAWTLKTWLKLFRQNWLVNLEEFRTYREWQSRGAQRVNGVGLWPRKMPPTSLVWKSTSTGRARTKPDPQRQHGRLLRRPLRPSAMRRAASE